MIIVTQYNSRKIADIARKESGNADFILLLHHDGDFKLSDAGDLVIPLHTKASVPLDMQLNQRALIRIISAFRGSVRMYYGL